MLCRFSGDAGSFRKTPENVTMLRQRSIGFNSQNSIVSKNARAVSRAVPMRGATSCVMSFAR